MTPPIRRLPLAVALLFPALAAAQQPIETSPPKPEAARPAAPAKKEAAPAKVQTLEVTEKRTSTSERRDSTAAKIVIGREEIEQYGDTNLGDVMRRLPGVTQGGRPGRGGPIRMRGMAGGFTQILINGERIPPGFSVEDITPDQVERIEILRAPTAETGTRAIAGTINIILREALRQRHNDVRLGAQRENGRFAEFASATRNDVLSEAGSYNVSLSAHRRDQANDGMSDTVFRDLARDAVTLAQHREYESATLHEGLHATARLQWRLGPGEQFSLQPFVMASRNETQTHGVLDQTVGAAPAPYATSASASESRFNSARFNTQLTKRLGGAYSTEWRAGFGGFGAKSSGFLDQYDAAGHRTLRQDTSNDIVDRSWNVAGKLARNWGETHKATVGGEWEQTRRRESPVTILNGEPQLEEFGESFNVKVRRSALYLQDEWDPTPNWATSLGVRWEGIETRSDTEANPVSNRSSVVNPLAHVVWRWDAPKRDQVRASVTQSYRAPTTQNLVGRPRLNTIYPVPGPNVATSPDAAGNPGLKPEVANGLELAFERYLSLNGVMSVNVFTRRLRDVIRNVTSLETVSWAPVPRWVSRPQNMGRAATTGIEMDAKFRLDELSAGAPPVNVRANLSVFRSRVDEVPGPDNRLASQPDMTANLGADYKFRGLPLSLGGSVNWTPAYDTRLTAEQWDIQPRKTVWDAYALWHVDSATRLRFTVATTDPRAFRTATVYEQDGERQSVTDTKRGSVVVGLRLEMRL